MASQYAMFRTRLAMLKGQYTILERSYASLSFDARRDLDRPNAAERFLCAAILQHQPSANDFDFPLDYIAEATIDNAGNELCPVWNGWFCEIRQAQAELKAVTPDTMYAKSYIINPLLTTAEGKLRDVANALGAPLRRV